MDREMYPEEIWEAIQRHPSGREAELDEWAKSVIEQDADEWADWTEVNFDPDFPELDEFDPDEDLAFLVTDDKIDRLEDLEF